MVGTESAIDATEVEEADDMAFHPKEGYESPCVLRREVVEVVVR